jgi:hypothetical protein
MPYGIKGKTKQWEEKTRAGQKIDSRIKTCVSDLVSDKSFKPRNGEDKKIAAIKVCKAAISRSAELKSKLG